jgi:hypothetical protein
MRRLWIGELERIRKEVAAACFKALASILLKGLGNT